MRVTVIRELRLKRLDGAVEVFHPGEVIEIPETENTRRLLQEGKLGHEDGMQRAWVNPEAKGKGRRVSREECIRATEELVLLRDKVISGERDLQEYRDGLTDLVRLVKDYMKGEK